MAQQHSQDPGKFLAGEPSITKDPLRPVYVCIHKDHSHVLSLPNGHPFWTHNPLQAQVKIKILEKDFNDHNYSVVTLHEAVGLLAKKQTQLLEDWKPVVRQIQGTSKLKKKFQYYKQARQKLGPHPIGLDQWLRDQLQID